MCHYTAASVSAGRDQPAAGRSVPAVVCVLRRAHMRGGGARRARRRRPVSPWPGLAFCLLLALPFACWASCSGTPIELLGYFWPEKKSPGVATTTQLHPCVHICSRRRIRANCECDPGFVRHRHSALSVSLLSLFLSVSLSVFNGGRLGCWLRGQAQQRLNGRGRGASISHSAGHM